MGDKEPSARQVKAFEAHILRLTMGVSVLDISHFAHSTCMWSQVPRFTREQLVSVGQPVAQYLEAEVLAQRPKRAAVPASGSPTRSTKTEGLFSCQVVWCNLHD
jgi:hypothetical protein